MRLLGIGVLAAVMLTAAAAPIAGVEAAPAAQATGTIPSFVRKLTSLPSAGAIAEPARYTVQFLADGSVAIGADCNRAFGSWTGGAGALDITVGGTTLAACEPGSLGDPFLQALDGVTGYTLNGSTLTLHGAAEDMTFSV